MCSQKSSLQRSFLFADDLPSLRKQKQSEENFLNLPTPGQTADTFIPTSFAFPPVNDRWPRLLHSGSCPPRPPQGLHSCNSPPHLCYYLHNLCRIRPCSKPACSRISRWINPPYSHLPPAPCFTAPFCFVCDSSIHGRFPHLSPSPTMLMPPVHRGCLHLDHQCREVQRPIVFTHLTCL